MSPPAVLVIGPGGVGGLYGALLARAGAAVSWLARTEAEADILRRGGLRVTSRQFGDFTAPAAAAEARADRLARAERVIVAVKTTVNDRLAEWLPAVCAPGAQVLMLQNGWGVEEAAERVAPPGVRILGGLAFVCTHKRAPGRVTHEDYGRIVIGAHAPGFAAAGLTPEGAAWTAAFSAAGLPAEHAADLPGARWRKLVWNIPFNGLSVVRNTTTDRLLADPADAARVWALMREVQAAARAMGRGIEDAFLDRMVEDTRRMTPYAPSMKLDYERGRPMEIAALYDAPIAAARAHGARMPETEALAGELRALEREQEPGTA
jgi:2-dehydropantoate 2-reductase